MARFEPRRELGRTGFVATQLGAGDLADSSLPFETCVGTLTRSLDTGLNVVDARYVDEMLPLARKHGVGSVCFKTFGAGKLLGDTEGYGRPLAARPRGKVSSGGEERSDEPVLPRLSVAECLSYTLTCDPDVALLGLSFPNEQDAAFAAAEAFTPLSAHELSTLRAGATLAMSQKGAAWWNPP